MALPLIDGYTLLPLICDWDDQPTWTLAWETEVLPAVRGNEGRGALRRFPRPKYELSFVAPTPQIGQQVLAALITGQLSAKCAVPFYGRASTLAQDFVDPRLLVLDPTAWQWAVGDHLIVFNDDFSAWAVAQVQTVNGTALILTSALNAGVGALEAGHAVYPLVYGRAELDEQRSLSGDVLAGKVTIIGQTYLIPEAPPAACPDLAAPDQFLQRPVFPFLADVSTDPTRTLTFEPHQGQVGFGAEVVELLQRYVAAEGNVTIDLPDGCSISALERFFGLSTLGRLHGFWLAEEARAAVVAGAVDTQHVIIDAQGLAATWQDQPAQTLCFRTASDDGTPWQYAQIAGVAAGPDAASETVALKAALGAGVDSSWDAHWLRYVRLKSDELVIAFDSENYGSAQIETVELPIEYRDVELGQRPAFGYHFWRIVAGARHDWYFTSFDEQVFMGDAHTQSAYLPVAIAHGSLETTLNGDKEELEIDTWMFNGNPLNAWVPFAPQYDLWIELLEVDLSAPKPALATVRFSGFVERAEPTGQALKVTCTTLTDRLQAMLPRFRVQGGCNYDLYDPETCRVVAANYSVAVRVVDVQGGQLLIGVSAPGLGQKVESWFQWGKARGTDADGLPVTRLITGSTPAGDGSDKQFVRLNAPFAPALLVGTALIISAGCNLDFFSDQGCLKFGNQANFGGHPYIAQNLSLKAVDSDNAGSK